MPTINIINDSDHLSFVSSVPSFTPHPHSHSHPHSHPPRLRHSPSIANLSRWVVNRISRRSLREEYTGSDRSDLPHYNNHDNNNDINPNNNQQDNPHHTPGYNSRQQRRQRRRRRHHRTAPLKEETNEDNDPDEHDEESEVEDSDEERLKEEYAAYCRAFTGSGCPDQHHPPSSLSQSRWTMEASVYPGTVSRSSSPGLSPPSAAAAVGREEGEYGVPSPHFDPLNESHPQLQPPPRILTPALYVQTQAQAQQRKHPTPEDRPVRPWWSTARGWVCARP
ncbi:hypothetical protein P168DRAFT_328161 [Aspergillus campestris IBT 28561]|uniref:Uncharacterized protein n=1 Tax=Aspergillus campestris (strain IBT 28561) TaxID=1392248 RepID=A0A2I1CZN3_ASPC2|nr:uncharacterized protein P168DRAFT_328161 [Aspergillus campestris IBT 28561]PKY03078.1 hypothetical protein P168DRAFT_328161 [Aspergillus campestris IBT 28561]